MKFNLLFYAALTALLAFSCQQNENGENVKPESYLDLSVSHINFETESDSRKITLSSSELWHATSSTDWCELDITSGENGEHEIEISVTENTDISGRVAIITFQTESETTITDEIAVIQNGLSGMIVANREYQINDFGGEIVVSVLSDMDYAARIPEAGWMKIKQPDSKAMEISNFTILVDTSLVEARRGVVHLTHKGTVVDSIFVNQATGGLMKIWAKENAGEAPYGGYYLYGENPCPEGYEIPSMADFQNLIDNYVSLYDHDPEDNPGQVVGQWFGPDRWAVTSATAEDSKGCLFLPSSGREMKDGSIYNKDRAGSYITCDVEVDSDGEESLGSLYFISYGFTSVSYGRFNMTDKLSVRCIKIDRK